MLPDRQGEKIMGKVRKHVRYDNTGTGKGNYNTMHDNYLYKLEYPCGMAEKLAANIIAKNMISQVDSEGHQYQLLNEVTVHKKDDSAISKVDGFIKSRSGNIHRKRKTCGWKILL